MKNTDLASASIDHVLTGRFVSVRLDGVRFSKLTRDPVFERPFDLRFSEAMQNAMLTLTTGGAPVVLAYTQSDEITVVLDMGTPPVTPWVGGRATKITTIMASSVATTFARSLWEHDMMPAGTIAFDARAVDHGDDLESVGDLLAWRMADAAINSSTTLARHVLGRRAIHGVSTRDQRAMLRDAGHAWEDELPEHLRLGVFAIREAYVKDVPDIGPVTRHRWVPTIMDARQMRAHLADIADLAKNESSRALA